MIFALLGEARMREPVRDQIEWRAVDLDSLIGIRRGCPEIRAEARSGCSAGIKSPRAWERSAR